jgi:hypothetical protein
MQISRAQILALVVAGTMAPWASAAESDSVNLGLGGLNPMPHCNATVYVVEYEHSITSTMTILGRGSGVDYRFNNGNYLENGRLRGVDVGASYYRGGGMQGFFMGASIGRWKDDWTFTQYQNSPAQWEGVAKSNSIRLNFEFGDRIPIEGTKISVMPEADLGKFFATRSCHATAPSSQIGQPCDQKSEVNAYIFFGVAVGFAF